MFLLSTDETGTIIDNVEAAKAINEALEDIKDKVETPGYFRSLVEKYLPVVVDKIILVLFAILLYFIGNKIIKYIRKLVRKSMEKSNLDYGIVHFVDSLLKLFLYFVLVIIIISNFGVDVTAFAAVIGSAGLAVGLALQGSLSNFAGGVLLLLLHPFKVGDYIIEDSAKNEGTVDKIELFYTTLVTGDNKVITIPNGSLANSSITNVSTQGKRRLEIKVGIGYEDDLKKAKEVVNDILAKDEDVISEEPVNVFVDELADSAVVIGVRAWISIDKFWAAKWRITEEIKLTFDKEGISIPFNQMDVNIKNIDANKS